MAEFGRRGWCPHCWSHEALRGTDGMLWSHPPGGPPCAGSGTVPLGETWGGAGKPTPFDFDAADAVVEAWQRRQAKGDDDD